MKMKNIFSVKLLIDSLEGDLEKSTRKVKGKQLLILWILTLWANHLCLEAIIRNALNLSFLQISQNYTLLIVSTHR